MVPRHLPETPLWKRERCGHEDNPRRAVGCRASRPQAGPGVPEVPQAEARPAVPQELVHCRLQQHQENCPSRLVERVPEHQLFQRVSGLREAGETRYSSYLSGAESDSPRLLLN